MSGVKVSSTTGDIDVDVGRTHIHLHRTAGGGTDIDVDQRAAPMGAGPSPIKKLNDALGELTTSYTSAISQLEKGAERTLYSPGRTTAEVLAERRILDNEILAGGSLVSRNPYLRTLRSPMGRYTNQYMKERKVVKTLLDIASSTAPVKEVYDASVDLRKWLLEYSTLGPYLTGKLLAVVTKVQDLLQEVDRKDKAYADLMEAMKTKEGVIEDLKLRFDAQGKDNSARVDSILLLVADLQAQLKGAKSIELKCLEEAECAKGDVKQLDTLTVELKEELNVGAERERSLNRKIISNQEAAKAEAAAAEAAFTRRATELNQQLKDAQLSEAKVADLNLMLETDKRNLESQVKDLKAQNAELDGELRTALDISKRLESSLEKELAVVQFWHTEVRKLSAGVLGSGTKVLLQNQLQAVGAKYKEATRTIAKQESTIKALKQELEEVRAFALQEKDELKAEHKLVRNLTKHLVDEEHYEHDLENMLKVAIAKYKNMREMLIENDIQHKRREADLERDLANTREEMRRDKAEMNATLEATRVKVEQAKKLASNATNLSKMMRLYDDDKVLYSRGLI